jgi:hypothetical protein
MAGSDPVAPHLLWILLGVIFFFALFAYTIELYTAGNGHSTPDRCWRAGVFYANRDDPALFVRKRLSGGWTVNFGHRWSWAVLTVGILLVLVPIFFAALPLLMLMHKVRMHPR